MKFYITGDGDGELHKFQYYGTRVRTFEELLKCITIDCSETPETIRYRLWLCLKEIEKLDTYNVILENNNSDMVDFSIDLSCDSKANELGAYRRLMIEGIKNIKNEIIKYLYQTRESDFEVKVLIKPMVDEQKNIFKVEDLLSFYADKYDMQLQVDGITYCRKKPHRKWEDIPAGFQFYNSLRKYKEYFSALEYYSYCEGDFNGTIYRDILERGIK